MSYSIINAVPAMSVLLVLLFDRSPGDTMCGLFYIVLALVFVVSAVIGAAINLLRLRRQVLTNTFWELLY